MSTYLYPIRAALIVVTVGTVAISSGGCARDRELPHAMMPTPPKECAEVLKFSVEPLPNGKSNAAKLAVDMTKEGALRQQEHAIATVCAEYALRTAGTMKEKDAPASADKGVIAAPSTAKRRGGPTVPTLPAPSS